MKEGTRRGLGVTVLLYCVFAAVYLLTAYPPPPKPMILRQWATMRPLVADSVLYDFVQQLLAQTNPRRSGRLSQRSITFNISQVLFEHAPIGWHALHLKDADIRYRYGEESAWVLGQLHREHILSTADTMYMRLQIARSADFRLESRSLPNCKIIPIDTLMQRMRRDTVPRTSFGTVVTHMRSEYQVDQISYLSAPLFSLNGRYAVTTVTLDVGAFCGVGNSWLLVMEKKGGCWHKLKAIEY